ncbi:Nucleotide-binding alpha-beta plait domain containing protein [Parasponia andersonii]|uniref:Nucleotide-binding alpha-beta plait domain containing protein n=1 Tax=Parasponia andersonii TaxID=3476 RepID=A0A2P5BCQ5_PARAD|nr:Nucleotide-binding alpha-beta plait domain containing protein [Parasponia andersonii]
MLSAGGLKSLLTIQSTTITPTAYSLSNQKNPSSAVFLFAAVPKNGFFIPSLRQFRHTHLAFSAVCSQRRNGFGVNASKKQGKRGVELLEMEGFDDELGAGVYGDEDDEEDEDEDEDGSMLLPLEKMKKWLENKPRGFGEGKVYDTSIEDNLLEEMQQSRLAQAANLNKLDNDIAKPDSKKNEQKKKANEVVPNGVRVRVINLPKKRNVHRDLSLAFKGFPGLISINPVVSGNNKTRDPICKGIAFVYFESEKDAGRFIQMFSRQSISFGKIQKQIKCKMIDSRTSDSDLEQSTANINAAPKLIVDGFGEDQSANSDTVYSSPDEWVKGASVEYEDPDDELNRSELEDINENMDFVTVSELNHGDSFEERKESLTTRNSLSLEMEQNHGDSFEERTESVTTRDSLSPEMERIRALEKKLLAKGKEEKIPGKKLLVKSKEVIPGSAKRLKVKEKAVLTDVFSKYALKSSPGSKNES